MIIKARPDNTYKSKADKVILVETRLARAGNAPQIEEIGSV
jgi:hypothetical protein